MPSLFTTAILAIIFTALASAQSPSTTDIPTLLGPSGIQGSPARSQTSTITTTAAVIIATDISTILGVTGRPSTSTAIDISTILGITGRPSMATSSTTKTAKTISTSETTSITTDVPTLLGPSGIQGGPGKYSSITASVVVSTTTGASISSSGSIATSTASSSAGTSADMTTTTTTSLQTASSTSQPASTSLRPYAGGATRLGVEIAGVGLVGALVLLVI